MARDGLSEEVKSNLSSECPGRISQQECFRLMGQLGLRFTDKDSCKGPSSPSYRIRKSENTGKAQSEQWLGTWFLST